MQVSKYKKQSKTKCVKLIILHNCMQLLHKRITGLQSNQI